MTGPTVVNAYRASDGTLHMTKKDWAVAEMLYLARESDCNFNPYLVVAKAARFMEILTALQAKE